VKKIPEFYKYMKFKACLNGRATKNKNKEQVNYSYNYYQVVVDATVLGDFSESNKKKEEKEIIFL
jgi:hypothetical protein